MPGSKSTNIYAYNILKAPNVQFDKEYSYLQSLILHLENQLEFGKLDYADFAEKLMRSINKTNISFQVDRVCLAVTHPVSRRLSVLSSHNSDRLKDNTMDQSYSCFVGQQSSILKVENTNIRIYSDIEDIVKAYEGKTVQRSLGRLKDMGVKSGLTIPIKISGVVSGILFLNNTEVGHFDQLKDADYNLLCLIKLVAQSCIQKSVFGATGVDSRIATYLENKKSFSTVFSSEEFNETLKEGIEYRFGREFDVGLSCSIKERFLFPSGPILYTVVKCLEEQFDKPKKINVVLEKEGDQLKVKLESFKLQMQDLAFLQDIKVVADNGISQVGGDVVISVPFEPVGEYDYSI